MKVKVKGIRASVRPTVTVYTLIAGNPRFAKGQAVAVKCSYFDIVMSVSIRDLEIKTRRVKRGTISG